MGNSKRSRMETLLDLLAEEVAERLGAKPTPAPAPRPSPPPRQQERKPQPMPELDPEPAPVPLPLDIDRPHAARLMGRLALGLLVLVVVINVPFTSHGTTLATAMPDSHSLIIRDGLVVKEENDEEIYVFQDGSFRWISSLDAFEHYGHTWGDVNIVEDGYLDDFERGTDLHVLLKCGESPHIYRLENGVKRWIVDIVTFEAEGHVWEDVRFVSCYYLHDLPDGETIPPGYDPPPQP